MSEVEQDLCDFCHENKSVQRTYLRPSKYKKSNDPVINNDLYNQGSYFIIIRTCFDCGTPDDHIGESNKIVLDHIADINEMITTVETEKL
jgi:hypothetical protein